MKIHFSKLIFFLIVFTSFSSAQNFSWGRAYGSIGSDKGARITMDSLGFVYVFGHFTGTVNFNVPGPSYTLGTVNVNDQDVYITKLDTTGTFYWTKRIGRSGITEAANISIDKNLNIIVSGMFSPGCDFDPGPATYTINTISNYNAFVSKLDNNGNFLWAKHYNSTSYFSLLSSAVDNTGNIFCVGHYSLQTDFNPTASYTLNASGTADAFISKHDPNGNLIWVKKVGGNGNEQAWNLTIDKLGNVLVTGMYTSNSDFDPGSGVFSMSPNFGEEATFVLKLDINGNFVWAKGLVSMTNIGTSLGTDVVTDSYNDVYFTGSFRNIYDFDPGPATYSLSCPLVGHSPFVEKLDKLGNFIWAKIFPCNSVQIGLAIAVGPSGNVISAGCFGPGPVDFDPGSGTYNLSAGATDGYVSILNSNGDFVGAFQTGGTALEQCLDVVVDKSGSIYSSGWYNSNPTDIDLTAGTLSFVCNGDRDAFVNRLSYCISPGTPNNLTSLSNMQICNGMQANLTVSVTGNVTWHPTITSTVILGSGPYFTTPALSLGTHTYYAQAEACVTNTVRSAIIVTVNVYPTVSVNSGSICSGSSFTMSPSGAATYSYLNGGPIVSPISSSVFSVIGTSSVGCTSSNTAVSTVTVYQAPNVSVTSGSICSGDNYTIVPSGASTYSFPVGGPIVSPTISSTFSVIGSNTIGCSNTTISIVTVNQLPIINANSSGSLICVGQQATLNVGGANTYTWNPGGPGSSIVVSPIVTTNYSVTGTDINFCANSTVLTVSVSSCTGINEQTYFETRIYPNPFNSKITIVLNDTGKTICIYNYLGSLIHRSVTNQSTVEIDLSIQPSGIYFLKIGTNTWKLVKE